MPRASPHPGQTVAILFGAAAYPQCASLDGAEAFSSSAKAFRRYLKSAFALDNADVLWLFDRSDQPGEQVQAMRTFLERKRPLPLRDVVFYYCGHGAYLSEDEYVLALRCTDAKAKSATTFRISYLVEVISDLTRDMRNLVVLDACYSGAALGNFLRMSQGGEVEAVAAQVFAGVSDASETEDQDHGGAILFCAAGPRKWAKAPLDAPHTMFTGAVLDALTQGDPVGGGATLSLKRTARLVERHIRQAYGHEAVQPQIHVPVQGSGDLLEGPYFPNAALRPADGSIRDGDGGAAWLPTSTRRSTTRMRWAVLGTACLAAIAIAAAAVLPSLRLSSTTTSGTVYGDARPFFENAVRRAGLQPDAALFARLKLSDEFVGRRLSLLSFTSFEGTTDDLDWWGLIQPGELPGPGFPSPRPHGPVEKPFVAVSGMKSKNYAPASIPVGNGLSTMTADRVKTVFPAAGMRKIYLRYNRRSDTNPLPSSQHNCGSFLAVLYRQDGGPWSTATHICGANKLDADAGTFQEGIVPFTLPPGTKTFEIAFAFDVQGVNAPITNGEFLVDDMTLFGEY